MKDFTIIKDPEVAKLFADPVRRDILHSLRFREMTVCQLAKALDKNVSSISYHLNALELGGTEPNRCKGQFD
jgi:DNA-binding transcriptional ArsR family regulator